MMLKILVFHFLLFSKLALAGHGCGIVGCDQFYNTMMSAPGKGPCSKCASVGLHKCPGRPEDLSEHQWVTYFRQYSPDHGNYLSLCPNFNYGIQQIRWKAGLGQPQPGPRQLSPAELLQKSAEQTKAERLKIDKDVEENARRSEQRAKKEIEQARNKIDAASKSDPASEREYADTQSKASRLKEALLKKRLDAFCFPANTPLVTWEGERNIQNVSLGDLVIANDFQTSQCVVSRVEKVYEQEVYELINITVDGSSFQATPNHPLYIIEADSFLRADEIAVGDHFLSLSGEGIVIEGLQKIYLDRPITVYNLEIQDHHNYFVSDRHINAHNCDGFSEGLQETLSGLRDAVLHPIDTAANMGKAVLHVDEIALQVAENIAKAVHEFPEYSATEQGELLGKLTAELAALLVPGAAIKAGSHLAKIAANAKLGSKIRSAMNQVAIENDVLGKIRVGSAHKADPLHAFPDIVDNYVGSSAKFEMPTKGPGGVVVRNSDLFQIEGSLNGKSGIFEWIVDKEEVTHRRFIPNGKVSGYPNQVPKK